MVLWIAFAIVVVAVAFDIRSRQIPDSLSVSLLVLALLATGMKLHRVSWLDQLAGFGLGLLIGAVLFWLGGVGGGDAKLVAALGAVLGWRNELGVLFWTALMGAAFAVIATLRKQQEYAYAPAIASGLLAFILWGNFP